MKADLSPEAVAWLAHGERGISSEAMFERFTGIPAGEHRWFSTHPSDGDDFKRCEKLLRAVPEFREKLALMADVSRVWAALVERWDEIAALLEEELPGVYEQWPPGGRAPRTYALMREIVEANR